jgi:hypothetical protein
LDADSTARRPYLAKPANHTRNRPAIDLDGYWVCVVVVEVAGTACTAGVEVVVLVVVVGGGVAQPESADAMTTAAKQAMMSFFISIFFVWLVTLTVRKYAIGWSQAMGCNPTLR